MISCLRNSMQWFLCAWQGHEHTDNPSVVALAVTGVRSLSEATWLPSGDIIYDANEMWACIGHRKVSDESPALSSSSITEGPPLHPPVEAYRKPEPVLLWLMFRLMHLQDYLFWACHFFVIAAAGFLRLGHGLRALFWYKVTVRNIWLSLKRIKSSSTTTHLLLLCKTVADTEIRFFCCYLTVLIFH